MPTIAYLANCFPAAVEPYVMQEISELRHRGISVVQCAAESTGEIPPELQSWSAETLRIQPLRFGLFLKAAFLCFRKYSLIRDFLLRILFRGNEPFGWRVRAIAHTFLGAYFAVQLERYDVDLIHVHHGYFASWIAMIASRLKRIPYSLTLHGSDLLIHKAYLDVKLRNCELCVTVSEFNRRHILEQYPEIEPDKIVVRRMGVDTDCYEAESPPSGTAMDILAVGRLHLVKNYQFLIKACARLKSGGFKFSCLIAGEGEQRKSLQQLIHRMDLEKEVNLLGHLPRSRLQSVYADADLVVLTSQSEGLPVVLMEAMARGKIVLAPAITGVPELVVHGLNGFLFEAGSLDDFIRMVECIRTTPADSLKTIREAARKTVVDHFDRETNQSAFIDLLIQYLDLRSEAGLHEDLVLQQI